VVLRVKELYDGISQGGPADIRKLKRSVQSLVDSVYKGETTLLRLTAIRKKEDLMPRHYANVSVLSLCIGKRLGLSKYQMARLGMAALLHDIGRQMLPQVTGEDEEIDYSALEVLKKHPRMGVETLLRLKGLNEVAVSAMIVAYEHHRNLDDTGYPEVVEPKEMNLYSRVVRIADYFDSATSSGIYSSFAIHPDKALAIMKPRAGSYYDSGLFELFLRVTGAYPVGTFALLSDGSTGVVCTSGRPGEGFDRPFVKVISGSEKGKEVDLTEKDGTGQYKWNIAGTLDPEQYRVNIYRYLI
jgi:HD-GYP domain-containing protein (c-di-GMP phosphodiesterase class II)